MGGGLMQLVAYGAQDIYLTGNPQITFFKVVYRRHTNFSMEEIQQTLSGNPSNNGKQDCIISRNGDLISNIWFEIECSFDLTQKIEDSGYIYETLKYVDCEIGGQLIDRQTNDWNAIWWNLTTPESKVNGMKSNFSISSGTDLNQLIYLPLNFWFCRNPGLALPIIALQYHEVKLKIEWNDVTSRSPKLWVNYIFLDTDERRRFAQVSHEYLIEQVQRQTFNGDSQSCKLTFNHPIKELIWVNDVDSTQEFGTSFAPLRCSETTIKKITESGGIPTSPYSLSDKCKIKLQLNGHDRFAERNAKYFKNCQVLDRHTRCPAVGERITYTSENILITNASSNASFITPTSILNGSSANGIPLYMADRPLRLIRSTLIGGFNANNVASSAVNLTKIVDNSNSSYNEGSASATKISLATTIDDGIIPMSLTNDISERIILKHQRVGLNLGDITDFSGSLVNTSIKFSMVLEELPILIGGDTQKHLANIYCYSFALKPEEHQPSGTCNFSRIDNAKLIFDTPPGTNNTKLKVFAVNYNVLRIMSGLGGLAYSN